MKDLDENPVPPPQWLVEGAPVMSDVLVDGKKGTVEGYRATPDDTFYVQVKEEGKEKVTLYPWQEVKDLQGFQMITAPDGVEESPEYKEVKQEDAEQEAEEKPSSNRKYSLDNSDNLMDNSGRKYSLSDHIRSGHGRVNNKVVLNDTGTAIKSIELGLPVGMNESHDERVTRRLREIEGIDYTLINKGGNSAFVNLVPDIQKTEIDDRIRNGADPAELIQHYKVKFNTMIARYADGLSEEKRIGYALLLKGAAYYVAEKTGTPYNRERGGGIFDERPGRMGQRAGEAGNYQNSIRATSRSEESGFSNARSMDDLKAEVKEAFPNAKVQEDGSKLSMTMPNGQKATFPFHESIALTILSEGQNG